MGAGGGHGVCDTPAAGAGHGGMGTMGEPLPRAPLVGVLQHMGAGHDRMESGICGLAAAASPKSYVPGGVASKLSKRRTAEPCAVAAAGAAIAEAGAWLGGDG